jgi:hypothetical protein
MPVRRFLLIPLAIAALGSGQALADEPSDPVELSADVSSCQTGAAADDRVVVFQASMPADPPAVRLAMTFELQQRLADDDDFQTLDAPNFGDWQKSKERASGYIVDKRVQGLAPGTAYRVVVRFRWYAKGGKILRSAKRTSPMCKQPASTRAPVTART